METPTLSAYILPSIYSDEALKLARDCNIDALSLDILIIRFWLALSESQFGEAALLHEKTQSYPLGGWPLYQVLTGNIFLQLSLGTPSSITQAIEAWLNGRDAYPGNWQNGVLSAPEIMPYLTNFSLERLEPPRPKARENRVSRADREFVKDLPQVKSKTIADNLHFLRDIGIVNSERALIRAYKLRSVDRILNEALLRAPNDLPDIIVALDKHGNYVGSFLAH
jgi:hypothetical protein